VRSNVYGSCVSGNVADVGAGVIKWLWEMCWSECSYWWGWFDQMVIGTGLVGV